MNSILTSIRTKTKENLIDLVAKPKTIEFGINLFLNRSTFVIEIDETTAPRLFNNLIRHIQSHTLIKAKNNFRIHRSPQKSSDVITPGNGYYVFSVSNMPFVANIGEIISSGAKGINTSRYITIRGLNTARSLLDKLIHKSYPEDIFLPYVFRDGRIVGLVETRYGQQRQFVNNKVYNKLDKVISRMVNDKEYYINNDLPHKETILLYGPPGTGKSTIVRHFASKYGLNIYTSTPREATTDLCPLIDDPSILLLEDIDAYPELLKEEYHIDKEGDFDYSSFINFLDGVVPLKNVIVFMTTNFKEKLLESVVRAGRVDLKIHMPRFTIEEIKQYTEWGEDDERTSFVMQLDPKIVNVAVLKKLTLCDTLEECESLIESLNETN